MMIFDSGLLFWATLCVYNFVMHVSNAHITLYETPGPDLASAPT